MNSLTFAAFIVLIAFAAATSVDHSHHAGTTKHPINATTVINWTTGTQSNGTATLNETKTGQTKQLVIEVLETVPENAPIDDEQTHTINQDASKKN